LGTPLLTLFADASLRNRQRGEDAPWSVGAEVQPVAGLQLSGRYRRVPETDADEFLIGIGYLFGASGYSSISRLDEDGDHQETVHVIRVNAPRRDLPLREWIPRKPDRLVTFDLSGKTITDHRDLWFDSDHVAWLDLTGDLRRVVADPEVAGVALDLSGTSLDTSKLWELRAELLRIRDAGKHVWIHLERPRMAVFYLASVADRVSMDPYGMLDLTGLAVSRSYWRGCWRRSASASRSIATFATSPSTSSTHGRSCRKRTGSSSHVWWTSSSRNWWTGSRWARAEPRPTWSG
jgi:hypothetical protein